MSSLFKEKKKNRRNHKYRKLRASLGLIYSILASQVQPSKLVHAYNTSSEELQAKGSGDQRHPQLPGESEVSLAP